MVYYSAKRKVERMESFYTRLSETENRFQHMMNVKFSNRNDMIRSVTKQERSIGMCIWIKFSGYTFTYSFETLGNTVKCSWHGILCPSYKYHDQ